VEIEAVLHEQQLPLSRMLALKAGDTVMFERSPHDPIRLRCGGVELTEAIMGHIGNHVSVRVTRPLNPPKVTMAEFEALEKAGEGR
jgi:flagellar motor switch protein FliM